VGDGHLGHPQLESLVCRYAVHFGSLFLALPDRAFAVRGIDSTHAPPDSLAGPPNIIVPVGVGAGLGFLGFGVGLAVGAPLGGWGGAATGALIGTTIGVSSGVHLGNDSRGNSELVGLTAAAVAVTCLSLAVRTDDNGYLIALPFAQLAACVLVERTTSKQTAE
jgi:hypothetical protein